MSHVWKERAQERRQAVSTGEKKKNIRRRLYKNSEVRRNEKELERIDDKPTPVIEGHNSEDNSDELPDFQL